MTGCICKTPPTFYFLSLLIALFVCPADSILASDNNINTLWVSSGDTLFNISPQDGNPVFNISPITHIQALAVDDSNNHIWIYGKKHVWVYDALGNLLINRDLPRNFHGSDPIAVLVDSNADNVWIGIHKLLYRLNHNGDLVETLDLNNNIQGLALDQSQSYLWIALDQKLMLLDNQGVDVFTVNIDDDKKPISLSYDHFLNQAWLASKYHISRYDNAGALVLDAQLSNAELLDKYSTTDGQGGLWLAGNRYLAHLNDTGQSEYMFKPFDGEGDDESDITGAVSDTNSHTIWISNHRYLKQYDLSGNLIQQIDSHSWLEQDEQSKDDDSDNNIRHIAFYGGSLAPVILIADPENNSYTNYSQPNILITYVDRGNGIDPDTITITSNDEPLQVTCQSTDIGAQCNPVEGMPDGMYAISVTAEDHAGNVSDPAHTTFTVDTTPPSIPSGNLIGFQSDPDGSLTLIGQSGSVVLDTESLTITNIRTGETVSGTANLDGSFSIKVPGTATDEFIIVLRDKAGNSSTTVFMHGNDLPLQLAITSPVPDSSIAGDIVNVTGTFHGARNAGIKVNGIPAILTNNNWVANNIQLQTGINTLEVTATTGGGLSISQSIQITSTESTQLILNATPSSSGIAPLPITYQYQFLLNKEIDSLEIDYTGNGTFVQISDSLAIPTYTYAEPGIYPVTLRLTDSDNIQYQALLILVVQDISQMDTLFHGIWSDFTTALLSGNKIAAMHTLDGTAQRNYGSAFDVLLPHMNDIVGSFSPLLRSSISSSFGEYAIVRDNNGQQNLFLIYFIKDQDGVWRLDSM